MIWINWAFKTTFWEVEKMAWDLWRYNTNMVTYIIPISEKYKTLELLFCKKENTWSYIEEERKDNHLVGCP